jgi:TonB family protein
VKVYSVGPGVTAPELLPLNLPPLPAEKCKQKAGGKVGLSLLVDSEGQSRNIMFLHPLGTETDELALQIAGADRFSPGIRDGKPVVVAESLDVRIKSCLVESKDNDGKKINIEKLRSAPEQELATLSNPPDEAILTSGAISWDKATDLLSPPEQIRRTIKAPVPILQSEAMYTDAARKAKINGSCRISLIVDPQGMPQNLHVLRGLDPGLDQNALYAVGRYRFKPAMRDGEPIPVRLEIELNFRLY